MLGKVTLLIVTASALIKCFAFGALTATADNRFNLGTIAI